MTNTDQRTLLVGCGAIGGTLAALINAGGYRVDVLEIAPKAAEALREKGLSLRGVKGPVRVYPTVYGSVDEIEGKYDIVIIAVKYTALIPAAKSVLPLLRDDSLVVGMQNGICTDELASVVGKERTVGCVIGFGATKISDTEIEMTSSGEMFIGMPGGERPPLLERLCKMYNCVLPTDITDALINRQYSKLIINCCINACAAITGKTLGEMLDDERAQDLFLAIAREGMAVASKMGIFVPKYGALLDYRLLAISDSKFYNNICKKVVKLVGKGKYAAVKPSTLQSLLRGEKTEIDIFNGWIAKKGEEYGVPVPVNAKLTEMIRQIERGEREMSMDNLDMR